jgi:hypothetical protein
MSAWALYVTLYLLAGIGLTEIGAYGYRKRGRKMGWWLYLIGVFGWPAIAYLMIRSMFNK